MMKDAIRTWHMCGCTDMDAYLKESDEFRKSLLRVRGELVLDLYARNVASGPSPRLSATREARTSAHEDGEVYSTIGWVAMVDVGVAERNCGEGARPAPH